MIIDLVAVACTRNFSVLSRNEAF